MSENNTNTAEGGNTTTPQEDSKTFTQDDVNRIVSERLAKDRAKAESDLAKREQEIAAREFQLTAQKTLTDRGFSPALLDALNMSNPEAFEKSLSIISELYGDPQKPQPTLVITAPGKGLPPGLQNDPIREVMGLNKKE